MKVKTDTFSSITASLIHMIFRISAVLKLRQTLSLVSQWVR